VPDLVAEIPDIWTLASLTDTVNIVRSLSEVCGLDVVDEILDSADGFAVLPMGQQAFVGRNGEKLWNEMGAVIAETQALPFDPELSVRIAAVMVVAAAVLPARRAAAVEPMTALRTE